MKKSPTIFNLKRLKRIKGLLLVAFAFLVSSSAYSQSTTIIANGSSPNGTDDAGDTIVYSVSVTNTGGESLSNVVFTNSLGVALTLSSGDVNNNSILDINECWEYSGTYTVLSGDIVMDL